MRCPTCKQNIPSSGSPALPFCCERCREIDLGRWLGESYSLQTMPDPEADEVPQDDWAQEGNSLRQSEQKS